MELFSTIRILASVLALVSAVPGFALPGLGTTNVPNATLGQAYSATLAPNGGSSPYTIALLSGVLPNGISISSPGVISGTPLNAGSFNFVVRVTDSTLAFGDVSLTLLVVNPSGLQVNTTTLPNGQIGQGYSVSLSATGGTTPYTWDLVPGAGNLPNGLTIVSNGNIQGSPNVAGTFNFAIRVTDSTGANAQASVSIQVNSNVLSITSSTLPNGGLSTFYSQAIPASGGALPYSFGLTGGTLPIGLSLSTAGVVSGTPGALGTSSFTVQVIDSLNNSATRTLSLTINPQQLAIVQTSLPTGQLNFAYSASVTAAGGASPYIFALTSGSLPTGIGFTPNGVFSGTPSVSGSFPITIRVTDNASVNATANYTLQINANNLSIVTTSLQSGTIGQAYTTSILASGGQQPYTFSLASGSLPPGLGLDSFGNITGTPTQSFSSSFVIRVTDAVNAISQGTFTISVSSSSLLITSNALASGQVGQVYTSTLTAVGGTAPYTWTLVGGSIATGLTLGANGNVSGIPSTAGSFQGTYRVTDAANATAQVTITIAITSGGFTIVTSTLPSARVNQIYSTAINAIGGNPPYSFQVTSGQLPAGVTLSGNGNISGTPTAQGSFPFTVIATDNSSNSAQANYTITVNNSSIALNTTNLPAAQLNQPYSAFLNASGGVAPYSFLVVAGGPPNGLLVFQNGSVSGTPTQAGTYNFTVRVSDNIGSLADFNLNIVVAGAGLSFSSATLPAATQGLSYNATFTITGGSAPYSFVVSGGGLPSGISLAQNGTLSGTPSNAGSFPFTVRATDSLSSNVSANFTLTVNSTGTLTITTSTLPNGRTNQSYSASIGAAGGSQPYTFSIAGGALPNGLILSSAGVISGVPAANGNFTFVVRVNDSAGGTTQSTLSIAINLLGLNGPSIVTTALPNAQLGQFYSTNITATGGAGPYTFAIVNGSLPNGFNLSTSGNLAGLPSTGGTFPIVIRVTDSAGATSQSSFNLLVGSTVLTFVTTSLPQAFVGMSYSAPLQVSGGAAPYVYALTSGVLPTGLSLSAFTGEILGIPTTSSFSNLTFRVTDATNATSTVALNLVVGQNSLQFATTTVPSVIAGTPYNFTLVAAGGTSPYSYSLSSGSLPPGLTLSPSGVISGLSTQNGTYPVSFRIQDSVNTAAVFNTTLTVNIGALQILTTMLPSARINQPYSQTISASGGVAPIRFELLQTINSGFLPAGLTLSQTGVISGTPQALGASTFTIRAVDSQNQTAQATYTLTVLVSGPSISPITLPEGAVGQAYNQTFTATGGTAPYTFSLIGGNLPAGVSIGPFGGLTGTPTAAGVFTFTARVADTAGLTSDSTFTLTIRSNASPLLIGALAPPPGLLYFPYNFTLTATGGRAPYSWSIPAGPIPNGLRLESTGVLNGILLSPGTYRFTARVVDADSMSAEATLGITVAAGSMLTGARVGAAYSAQVPPPANGRAPFTFSQNANALGSLPQGLSLSGTGALSGTPTVPGEYTFGVSIVDASGFNTNAAVTIVVAPAALFSIVTPGLPGAAVGAVYSQRLSASGGREPYNWSVLSGQLPNGFTLNPLTGQITGSATLTGNSPVTVRVTDALGASASAYYVISVAPANSPLIGALTSAGSYVANGIAPGELIVLFGGGQGPGGLTSFTLIDNAVPTVLSGTRVLFDGVPAPILYTRADQVSAIAPFSLAGRSSTRVVVEYLGVQSAPFLLPVLTSKPALFTVDGSGQGPGAILNQNNTLNTQTNRAAKESVVVLYLTGGGPTIPAGVAGAVATGPSSLTQLATASVNGQTATVQYAGDAPGLVQGVIQMNIKLPPGTISGVNSISVTIGPNSTTANVTVWVE